ncbi:MAG: hypothetical protein L0211_14185 [Planctomycetaceae bacterium]|nr:hypothetical protein [Planctomycetaceae bacterium]
MHAFSRLPRRSARRQLRLEPLERRTVLAGNVVVLTIGDDLLVLGDHRDNALEIAADSGQIVVRGSDGTSVNGQSELVLTGHTAVADDLRVLLDGGSDRLVVRDLSVGGDLQVLDGLFGGHDHVTIDRVQIGDDLLVVTGSGADAVLLDSVAVADDTTILTGSGDDRLAITNSQLTGDLRLDTGSGADFVLIDPTTVGGDASVRMGDGADTLAITLANQFGGETTLDGGRGSDRLLLDPATTFAGPPEIRSFESSDQLAFAVIRFSPAEGLAVRNIPAGNPPGTGSTTFSLQGANFSGGEVVFAGVGALYASPPQAYKIGATGGLVTFDQAVDLAQFWFIHEPGDTTKTATAFDAAGNVVATATSRAPSFLNDPLNFVTLVGTAKIARIEISGGKIDDFRFVRSA